MSSLPQKKWKNLLRWLPGVLISAIALYAVFKLVQFQDLKSAFTTASWQFLGGIFVLDTISLLIRGKAWQTILGNKVNWKQAFFGVSEGYFLNNLFPFRAGEIGRSIFVGKSSGLGTFHVLSTIVIERAFDIAMAAILVLATLPLVVGMVWVKTIAITALVIVLAAIVGLFIIARNQEKVSTWIERIGKKNQFVEKYIVPQIYKLITGLSTLTQPKQFLLSFFWIAFSWFSWVVIYNVMVRQILPGAPLWTGAFIGSLLSLGVAIPAAPAALGVYEASMVAAVMILGGAESSALAYALLMHFMQFFTSAIFGIWGLVRERQSISSLMSTLKLGREETPTDQETKK